MFYDLTENKLKIKLKNKIVEYSELNSDKNFNLLDVCDYTAWEVFPTDKAFGSGEFKQTFLINGKEETFSNTLSLDICKTEQICLFTNSNPGESDVIIDWGDGSFVEVKNIVTEKFTNKQCFLSYAADENQEYKIELFHEYEIPNKTYTIKVFGKKYFRIGHVASRCNIMSRCLSDDLPIAQNVTNMANFATRADRLLYVCVPAYHRTLSSNNWDNAFLECKNLLVANGFKRLYCNYSLRYMFKDCINLTETDLRIPQTITDITSIFQNCEKLNKDINSLFANQNNELLYFLNNIISIGDAFNGCSGLSGEINGKMFWNNLNTTFLGKKTCFSNCGVSNKAPFSWGGMNSIVDEDTEKIQPFIIQDCIIPGILLRKHYNCYRFITDAWDNSVVNLTFNTDLIQKYDGFEFYLMLDFTKEIKTVKFPTNNFKWKSGQTIPTMNAQKLYIFKCTYIHTEQIEIIGEFITDVDGYDFIKGIWLFENEAKNISNVISGYNGLTYVPTFNIDLNENVNTYYMSIGQQSKIEEINVIAEYNWDNNLGSINFEINGGYVGSIHKDTNDAVSCPGVIHCKITDGYLGSFGGTWQDSLSTIGNAEIGSIYECGAWIDGGHIKYMEIGTYDCARQDIYGGSIETLNWIGFPDGDMSYEVFNALIMKFTIDDGWQVMINFSYSNIDTIDTHCPGNEGENLITISNSTVKKLILSDLGETWNNSKKDFTIDILSGTTIDSIERDDRQMSAATNFIINIKSGATVNIKNSAHPNNVANNVTYNIESGAKVNYIN